MSWRRSQMGGRASSVTDGRRKPSLCKMTEALYCAKWELNLNAHKLELFIDNIM